MEGPPGLGIRRRVSPGGGLHVVAGWPWPPAGVLDEARLRVDHARPTVNGSGYQMEGPPGLGLASRQPWRGLAHGSRMALASGGRA